jgi:hypothetical protein
MDQQDHPHAAHETANMHHHLNALEEFFETYLHKKLGLHLPKGLKDFIVGYGPWLLLVLAVLGILDFLPLLHYGWAFFQVEVLISLVVMVLELVAVPGLLKRKLSAWHMVYYSWLLWAVGQLLVLNLVNLIVGLAIGMYLLFQIREYYH